MFFLAGSTLHVAGHTRTVKFEKKNNLPPNRLKVFLSGKGESGGDGKKRGGSTTLNAGKPLAGGGGKEEKIELSKKKKKHCGNGLAERQTAATEKHSCRRLKQKKEGKKKICPEMPSGGIKTTRKKNGSSDVQPKECGKGKKNIGREKNTER